MSGRDPFARLVEGRMRTLGLGLRELCRRSRTDPSLLSKVLSGKRSPPWDPEALVRLAEALGLDEDSLSLAAGRLPRSWGRLREDPGLARRVAGLIGLPSADPVPDGGGDGLPGGRSVPSRRRGTRGEAASPPLALPARSVLAEELL